MPAGFGSKELVELILSNGKRCKSNAVTTHIELHFGGKEQPWWGGAGRGAPWAF